MAIITLEDGLISDSFTMGDAPMFSDALVMPSDQYNALTADEIAAMKQQRYDNWLALVTSVSQDMTTND